jgi:hypothetical protein
MEETISDAPAHWSNNRRYFYKYVSGKTCRAALEHRTLRWSTPATLNDPFDIQFDLHLKVDRAKVKQLAAQKLSDGLYGDRPAPVGNVLGALLRVERANLIQLNKAELKGEFDKGIEEGLLSIEQSLPEFQRELRAHMARSKILCLTELPDNSLMWSHYADQHRGAVLRLASIPALDSAWGAAKAVHYATEMPRLLDEEHLSDILSGRTLMEPEPIIDKLVFTKAAFWSYEQEWRVYAGDGGHPAAPHEDSPFSANELNAVIFGCRMPADDARDIAALAHHLNPNVSVLVARKDDRSFGLAITPAGF